MTSTHFCKVCQKKLEKKHFLERLKSGVNVVWIKELIVTFVNFLTKKWTHPLFKRNHINKPKGCINVSIVAPSFSGKTYLSVKKLKNDTLIDLFVQTRSPEQYEDFDAAKEVSDIDAYKSCIVVFGETLYSMQKAIDPLFTRSRLEDLGAKYL